VSDREEERRDRLSEVFLDEETIPRGVIDIDHERAVAIFDLIEENAFGVPGRDDVPYTLTISQEESKLTFDVRTGDGEQAVSIVVSMTPLRPLLGQLFLKATLLAKQACTCDEATAREKVRPALVALNRVAMENAGDVDGERWQRELDAIAASDALNAYLSGFACALVLERGRIDEEELGREVSRRLSPGIHAEVGAGWFEGLVGYNRQALFSRLALWRQLDAYLVSLDDEEFRHGLVYLRRAFSEFAPGEVRRVVSNLVEISQEGAKELKASVEAKLSDDEAAKLQEMLGDLDI